MGWDYCCCAIPILNVGAYLTLTEQFVLGILVGTLSFSTPSLVGSAVPFGFANLIVCGLGYLFAIIQLVGFIGIFKEKSALFRRYVTINWIVLYVVLSVIATFIGISAARHSTAVQVCEKTFFPDEAASTTEDNKGEQICEIFCWVSVGIMGGLWLLLGILQSYLVLVLRSYAVTQKRDHIKYTSIYSTAGGETMMLNDRSGSKNGNNDDNDWNARPSTDSWHPRTGQEYRDNDASTPVEEYYSMNPGPDNKGIGYGVGQGAPVKQPSVDTAYLEYPTKAYTDDPGPTPSVPEKRWAPPSEPPPPPSYDTQEPPAALAHPAEGSMGRKTPRQNTYTPTYAPEKPYDPYIPR